MFPVPATSARQHYLDGLAQGELRYQHDPATNLPVFYPREVAPSGQFGALEWRVSAGRGVIYSCTDVFRSAGAYNVVMIQLDEGFRVMSTIPGAGVGELKIGSAVAAYYERTDDGPRLVFKVVS